MATNHPTSPERSGSDAGTPFRVDRREFLTHTVGALATLPLGACIARPLPPRVAYESQIPNDVSNTLVNDVHSQLNATRVASIVRPATTDDLVRAVREGAASGQSVCIAGGRHAMGGQQFAENALLVDTRSLKRVIALDEDTGIVTVE